MAIANYFYNQTTRKYVALFGTLFNQLKIERTTTDGSETQSMIVPLSYAPFQKILSRVQQDPDLLNSTKPAISLPRMSFEITNMFYDPTRKVATTRKMLKPEKPENGGSRSFIYSPTPYNIDFSLYIMTKYSEDAVKILEQILPFFTPDWTVTARMLPDVEPLDIPVVLNSVSNDELYEGDYTERPTILYTLSFTLKGWYFGPEREKKVIKFVEASLMTDTASDSLPEERVTVRPGLDANGNPIDYEAMSAVVKADINNGIVTNFKVINNGAGYNTNAAITVSDPSTLPADITPVLSNTLIDSFLINEGGGYYTSVPNIVVSSPDAPVTNAEATAVGFNGSIFSINISNPGTFYDSASVTIANPIPKSLVGFKFGNDAYYTNDFTSSETLHTTTTNFITAGTGFAIEFWIYPETFSSQTLNIFHFSGQSLRIETEPTGAIVYRPSLNAPELRSATGALLPNQWNHCRLEDYSGSAQWLVNGNITSAISTPAGFLFGGGIDFIVGQRNSTPSFIGAVDNVVIDNNISGLTTGTTYTVPTSPSTGSEYVGNFDYVRATATATVTDGEVTDIQITESGTGYTIAPAVTISAPDGNPADWQASATAVITNGTLTGVNVVDGGKFYISPTVTIDAPLAITATGTPVLDDDGQIQSVTVTNPGAGYGDVPTVTVTQPEVASIPYDQIEYTDDWGIITVIEDA